MRLALLLILLAHGSAGYGHWTPLGRPVATPWRAVRALPNGLCWIAGDNGTIFASSSFGQSWTPQLSGISDRLLNIDFISPTIGWVAGESGDAALTIDAGDGWSPVTITHDELGIGPPDAISALDATDATHAWALARWSDTTILYHTSDLGVTWPRISYTDHGYLAPATVYGMGFVSDGAGWLAAGRFNGTNYIPVLLRTTNGGTTWTAFDAPATQVNTPSDPAWVVCVQAFSSTLVWVHVWDPVHATGVLFQLAQTQSSGAWAWKSWTWNSRVNRIAFSDALHGIIVGDSTWQTGDGLTTISTSANPGAASLVAGFSSPYRGYAGGPDGSLYRWLPDNAGDANADGRINIVDACMLAATVAGRPAPSAMLFDLADADGDGQITITDAAVALRKAGGLSQ